MQISRRDWNRYIRALSAINQAAADAMQHWMDSNMGADLQDLIYTAYLLSDRYGEAAASLACEMYDTTAAAQGVALPPAEPAPTATYQETAKAVRGTMKNQRNSVPQTVGRLVKQAGADTMLRNAARDGAEFAWIPSGDTCAFCLTLASRGWQRQSKKAAQRHAEHIHANCDCTYQVRFDGKSTVEGYDPDKLLKQYYAADGNTPQEKINAMRRAQYAENKDKINAQKRAAYAARKATIETSKRIHPIDVIEEYITSAKPRDGSFVIESGYNMDKTHASEISFAHRVHDELGGDIVLLREKDEISGHKNPDYLWRGKLWDLKEPSTEKAADDRIRSGMKQILSNPGGIFLDYGEHEFDLEKLTDVINGRAKNSTMDSFDVIIFSSGRMVAALRYKK